MNDLPYQRNPDVLQGRIDALHDALDKSAVRREELCEERLAEHHRIRLLHALGVDGNCWTCHVVAPCPTMQVIDGEAVA